MSIVEAIFAVFTAIGNWIVETLPMLTSIFWTVGESGAGQLTFLGVLAVCGLGVGVILLLVHVITRFIRFR